MTKKISTLILFFVFATAAKAQSDYEKQTAAFSIDLAKKIQKSNKLKVAVSDFLDNDGNLTELGKAIAEDIGVGIVNDGEGTFQVMERSNLNAILKEQKLSTTGLIDPETAKQLGKLKMVDAVIVGNITPFGNSFRVTIKILDTETGMSIAAAAGNLAGTDDIKGLFNKKITIFNPTPPTIITDSVNKKPPTTIVDAIFEVGVSDMRKIECEVYYNSAVIYNGQACFENQTDYDLVLLGNDASGTEYIIPKGGRNCTPKMRVNFGGEENTVWDYYFNFKTINTTPTKTGTFVLTLEKCKLKSVVLTKKNLYLKVQ